jgi:ribokinase
MNLGSALFVGDASWDTTQRIPRLPGVDEKVNSTDFVEAAGGIAANAAVACARTGTQARALLRLGNDGAAAEIAATLAEASVSAVADMGVGPTTRATILLEPHGEKRLVLYGGVGLYPSVAAVAAVDLSGVRWVHTTLYAPESAAVLIARCHAARIPVSIDLEPASFESLDAIAEALHRIAVVFSNDKTEERLGDSAAALLGLGVRAVIRTRGPRGATWHDVATSHAVAAPRSIVQDTTGAGDCLAGWFIGAHLAGQTPLGALACAVHAATLSCGGLGSSRSYPTRDAVETSLKKGSL